MIARDACIHGVEKDPGDAYRRILRLLDENNSSDKATPPVFANQQLFADIRDWFMSQRMPMLVHFGVMEVAGSIR